MTYTTTYPDPNTDYRVPRETDGFTVEHLERAHADTQQELVGLVRNLIYRHLARFENDFGDLGGNYRVHEVAETVTDSLIDAMQDALGEAVNQVEEG